MVAYYAPIRGRNYLKIYVHRPIVLTPRTTDLCSHSPILPMKFMRWLASTRLGPSEQMPRMLAATSTVAGRAAFPLLLLCAGLVLVQPCAGDSGVFDTTGSLGAARQYHTATLLPNGKVQ